MVPIEPLMVEHRMIERMIKLLQGELKAMDRRETVDAGLIEVAVDFFRFYVDRCHHGKEEGILFAELASKPLSDEHRRTMDSLAQEHVAARGAVGQLLLDKERFRKGAQEALTGIRSSIQELLDLHPRHIDTEDNHFFRPIMEYFSIEEQETITRRFAEFDRKLLHERYALLIEELEERRDRKA